MSSTTAETPKQPLHLSVLSRLDPEYIEFHNKHVLNLTPPHTLPWNPAIRTGPVVPGGTLPIKVGKTVDYDLTHAKFRAFTPEGEAPDEGWPIFVFFHGGGWTLGNIDSENAFCTNMCVHAECVVITVDYRLAPEHPYPAAVEDAVESLDWVVKKGKLELNVNLSKMAIGGSSSGGNLAAILALKAAESTPPIPLSLQLLIVPVTDNTATASTSWKSNEYGPWLSPGRMNWFKGHYLPNEEDWTKWDASPTFAPDDLLVKVPKAWIAVAEVDILCEEGVRYGERMRSVGVNVEIVTYKGAPHPFMAMDVPLVLAENCLATQQLY